MSQERKYILPKTGEIFQVRYHISWAVNGPLKQNYNKTQGYKGVSIYNPNAQDDIYADLARLGIRTLVWMGASDELWLRGSYNSLPCSQKTEIEKLAFKLGEEGYSYKVTLLDDYNLEKELWKSPTLDESTNPLTQTPAFKAWFKQSKVVDAEGNPLVCYHVSGTDFNEFKPLSHFGTAAQARSLYYGRANKLGDPKLLKQTYPVYLSIQKPLRIEDMLSNGIYSLLQQVNKSLAAQYMEELREYDDKIKGEAKKKDETEYNIKVKAWRKNRSGPFPQIGYSNSDIAGRTFLYFRDNQHPAKYRDILIQEIKKKGYDGLVYLNRYKSNNPEAQSKQIIPTQFAPKENEMVDSYVVLDPHQIKSAIGNKGTFNPEHPSITEHHLYLESLLQPLQNFAAKVTNQFKPSTPELDPYRVALYELILKTKPTASVAIKYSLQDQIQKSDTLEKLEKIAGQHNIWSSFKQYINYYEKNNLNT